jgi:Flp pilus assembly protein TadG
MRRSAVTPTGDRRDRRRGAAAVELALVVPLFLLLIGGSLEAARVCSVSEILTNIARDGCRVAAANGKTNSDAQTRMTTLLSNAGITGYTISITPTDVTTSQFGGLVTVTVGVPFGRVSWLPMHYVMSSSTVLSGTATMGSEHNPPS